MKIALYVAALAILASLVGGLVHLSKKAARVDVAEAAQHAAEQKQVDQAEAFAKSVADFTQQQKEDQAKDAALSARLTTLEGVAEELRRAASRQPATVEKTDANGNRRVAINAGWWLCNGGALLGGDPTDTAACLAGPGASGLPAPVRP